MPSRIDHPKELKVRLPYEVHVRLHAAKILEGTPIGALVTQALEEYFANHGDPDMRGVEP